MCRFNIGDHVALVKSADYRNHYVVAAVLAPGEALKDSARYPGWSIRDYVNREDETVCVCPDALNGLTFVFRESELKPII